MEGTITVPGAGPVKKQYVYLGAAGLAGFLGYAYWRRSQSTPPPSWGDVDPGAMSPGGDYVNPGSNSNIPPQDNTGQDIKTNAQWAQAATTMLGNIGYDPKTVASALGNFFQRNGLSATEMDAVRAAVGQLGPPPQDGPWPIKAAPNTPETGPLAAVGNLRVASATANSITLAWDPVPGAKQYAVELHGRAGKHHAIFDYAFGGATSYTSTGLQYPNFDYIYTVRAQRDSDNGPGRQITARTTA